MAERIGHRIQCHHRCRETDDAGYLALGSRHPSLAAPPRDSGAAGLLFHSGSAYKEPYLQAEPALDIRDCNRVGRNISRATACFLLTAIAVLSLRPASGRRPF